MYWRQISILVLITTLVYLPGLTGGFVYDDYVNFLENKSISNPDISVGAIQQIIDSGISGPMGRPIPMITFYLNYLVDGQNPFGYKLVNLFIHLINAVFIFLLSLVLIKEFCKDKEIHAKDLNTHNLAFFISLIWAIHPINLTSVLYIVQRMTSLAGLFTLLGILFYCFIRKNKEPKPHIFLISLLIITLLTYVSALCKENGLLLVSFIFFIELFIFKFRFNNKTNARLFISYYLLVFLTLIVFLSFNLTSLIDYSDRNFSLLERLLTQSRVIWFYISQIIIPQTNLFGLHHDDFVVSMNIFEPVSTLFSIIAISLLLLLAWFYRKKYPYINFGILFFMIGHLLESSIFPLNLVHEHRNYIPSFGIILLMFFGLNELLKNTNKIIPELILLCYILLLFIITINRSYYWGDIERFAERQVQNHPESVNANYEAAFISLKLHNLKPDGRYLSRAINRLEITNQLDKYSIKSALALIHVQAMTGKIIDNDLIEKINNKLKAKKVKTEEIIAFRQLLKCQIEKVCHLSDNQIKTFFVSILNNDRLNKRQRDDTLYFYAEYLDNFDIDPQYAIEIMRDLASSNPDILEYQVGLIRILLRNNRQEEAQTLMNFLSIKYGYKWEIVNQKNRQ